MNQQAPRALPTQYANRLVELMNPHHPRPDGSRPDAQVACGRWLAHQRHHLGLTPGTVAARTLLSEVTLQLIEAGVATPEMLPPLTRTLLANLLTATGRPHAFVVRAVEVAAANWAALNDALLNQIWSDLAAVERPGSTAMPAVQEQEDPMNAASVRPSQMSAPVGKLERAILEALEDAVPRHFVAIVEAVSSKHKLAGGVAISLALETLLGQELIDKGQQHADPAAHETFQHFTITNAGRYALLAARKLAAAGQASPDDEPDPSGAPWRPKGAL